MLPWGFKRNAFTSRQKDWDPLLTLSLAQGSSTKPVCCFSSLYVIPSPSSCFDSLRNGCLSSCLLSSIFLFVLFVSRCRQYQNRYSHGTETTSLFSWLTCSTTSGLSMAEAGIVLGLGHSPLNKPCILSRGVCMRMRTKWRSNWAGSVFGVWEQPKLDAYYRLLFSLCKFAVSPSSSSAFKNVPILQDSRWTHLYSEVM